MENENQEFNESYIGPRNHVMEILPDDIEKILDVGCSIGILGEQIKNNK